MPKTRTATKPPSKKPAGAAPKKATRAGRARDGAAAETPSRSKGTAAAKKPAPAPGKSAPAPFEGFPKDFHAFFRELAKHNEREWFQANKDRYLGSVLAPMVSFIAAMDLPLGRVADCFVADARTNGGSMFRIYRDTRFSHDKTPYKTHAACHFRHEAGKDAHAPGFYVHLEPTRVFFGGGLWHPPGPELRKLREAIAEDPDRWIAITKAPAFRRRFGEVRGDALKRPPQGFDPDHRLVEELKRTSYFAIQEAPPAVILTKDFVRDVARCFEAMAPFMEFLTGALGLPFHRED
ncbi:MAG TPA: DUF2461 domain-containing protein [Candidatus Binatia bacterium]|jgi:uncharacterized protein (TIGR02453 family)